MNDRKQRRARRETVPATNKRATGFEVLRTNDPSIVERYTASERAMLKIFADDRAEKGDAFPLHEFAEILLRGAAVDYEATCDANGYECKRLLRGAWLFVREQLAADRFFSAAKHVADDPVFKYIDSIIKMLE